jgi:hypothetical protein
VDEIGGAAVPKRIYGLAGIQLVMVYAIVTVGLPIGYLLLALVAIGNRSISFFWSWRGPAFWWRQSASPPG